MCILLKLHYAKFDVSRLFCSKAIEEKPLGGRLDSRLGKGRVKDFSQTLASTLNKSVAMATFGVP